MQKINSKQIKETIILIKMRKASAYDVILTIFIHNYEENAKDIGTLYFLFGV